MDVANTDRIPAWWFIGFAVLLIAVGGGFLWLSSATDIGAIALEGFILGGIGVACAVVGVISYAVEIGVLNGRKGARE